MKNGNIKTIFFDAADTLFYIREGLGNTYAEVARKHGANPQPDKIKKAFGKAFASAPPLAFNASSQQERDSLEREWWRKVVVQVYEEIGMFDNFNPHFDELYEVFSNRAWALFPETPEVLTKLKAEGYHLGIISNFDSRVYNVMRNLGIYNYFDTLVISSEAGHAKPAAEIFHIALNKSGSHPDHCIHIGDDIENDYYGATAVGIKTFLLDREEEHESHGGDEKLSDPNQLLELLNIK